MLQQKNRSGEHPGCSDNHQMQQKTYAFNANQITSATITTMIAPQTMGVTFFELPLRGESFGAWL
jgi:hypothetical protein